MKSTTFETGMSDFYKLKTTILRKTISTVFQKDSLQRL